MKKILIINILLLLASQILYSQKALTFELKKNNDVIYLSLDSNNKLLYFTSNKNNETDSPKDINTKNNSINIYIRWINPLRYKVSWRDSIKPDDRDKKITDFVNLLVNQFGSSVSSLNIPSIAAIIPPPSEDPNNINIYDFKNKDLLLLLLYLRENQCLLNNKNEISNTNNLLNNVNTLDNYISDDISIKAKDIYMALYNYKEINDYSENINTQKQLFKDLQDNLSHNEESRKGIAEQLKTLSIKNATLKSYINAVLSGYLKETQVKVDNNNTIITKLKSILDLIDESTKAENESFKYKGYYKIRSIEFDDCKKLETLLNITDYNFNNQTNKFTKNSEIVSKLIVFQKYDFISISVSSGIFYSNTTLKSFGVSNNSTGQFIVSEANITKYNSVSAIFLNLNFSFKSRYFAPLLQIGIDPTKKRPFMLIGGGFSIPSAKIAFSAGPIWTWNQNLNKLSVGEVISSTTDIEKDIQYKFDLQPKGWYLGIQYNF